MFKLVGGAGSHGFGHAEVSIPVTEVNKCLEIGIVAESGYEGEVREALLSDMWTIVDIS